MDLKCTYYTNETNDISNNDVVNFFHKYYASFSLSNNYEDVSTGTEYD